MAVDAPPTTGVTASVATASTKDELIAIVRRGVFDVALLDLSPLGRNPAAALALIESCQSGLPVVIISGSVAPDVDAPNVTSWVRKPFEVGEVNPCPRAKCVQSPAPDSSGRPAHPALFVALRPAIFAALR